MKESLKKLKIRKYLIATIIIVLLFFVIGLIAILKPSIKNIKISKVLTNTKTLSASVIDGVQNEITSNNYDEIKYTIEVNKDSSDTAVITGTLSNNENKYARFKKTSDSEVSDDGKTITVTTTRNKVTITLIVENAPYGITFDPIFTINSEDESKSKINVDPVTITGKSVEGTILDEEGTIYAGVELSLLKNGEEVKKTYSKEDGKYVFSLGDLENYEVKLAETKYKLVRYTEETTDQNRRVLNIVIKEVEPFSLNITKTISKLDLVVNGKKETFTYNDETKVLKSIKNAKTIEGSIYYNIYLKNDGEVKGTVSTIKDIIPDGMSFDESKNPGWTREDNNLFYTPLEGTELQAFEKTSAKLVLDIVKTDEAKTYINTAIAHGDDYKYVVYYLNNSIYKELYVINSDKIDNIDPHVENFAGWYTDRNYTNKYNFNNTVTKDIALYGKIDNKKYNVTFIDKNPNNDQETVLAIVEVPEGEAVDLVDHPEYNGYTFKCFELYNSCYDDDLITGDTELYTSYTVNNYEIEYNLDGGSVATSNPTSYTIKDEITLNNPTKEGYTFLGWTGTGLSEETLTVTIPVGSTGKRTYTAHYQINRSTLAINPNGGKYDNNTSIQYFTEDYGTVKTISNSERTGYTFKRYDHTDGGIYSNGSYTFDNNDGTLTAVYEIITYRIAYDNITDDERAFLTNPTEYDIETETFTLKNPNTRVDGQGNNYQDFLGWDDGNGNVSLTVTIPKGSIGNRTYTAVWRENADDYAITYNLNSGAYAEGKTNPSTYTRQTETFTLNNPGKNGYNFIGWTGTDLTGNTTTVTIPKGSAGDRAYTANYEVIPYEIHYHGLTTEEETTLRNPIGYNIESASITLNNPTRTGYEFIGWSGTDITDKSTSVVIPTGSTGNREYTANFEAIEYSLSYTLNDGNYETGKSNPDKYTIESADITLNNPNKNGYTFIGWSGTDLTGNENTTVTIPIGSIGHRSFLANYTPIVYNITYDYDGGSLQQGVTNIDRYTIESDEITFNAPKKEGYTFLHYKEGNNIITSIPTGSTGNKDLKAYYQINKFNVVYHNEDIIYTTDEVDWNTTTTAPSENPTKAHGIFLYWSEDGVTPFDFSTQITSNKDLYAVYEMVIEPVITYTPTLDETTNRTWVCSNSSNDECGDTVTITSGKDDPEYTLYYKIGDGDAEEYTGPFKVYENTTITAFAKKNNIYSPNATEDIINVDSIAPTINNPGTGSMSFNMTVIGTAQDAGSGVKKFTLYVKEKDALVYDDTLTYVSDTFDGIKDHAENYDHTFYGVQDNTEYIVKIVAEDYVGNISEKEVEVKTHPYVARVVGKNGILWYTVDPDTKEFVLEDGKEFLMFDSIQAAVDYCAEIQCTIQTNPILPVVNESVVIASNQDITIDLDGRGITSNENATFINNGKLQIVDRNPRMNGDEHESIGFLSNTVNKAIVNNHILVVGDGSSEPSETFIYPEMDRPIIEGATNAIEQNDTFYFFDGKIYGDTVALLDSGEDPITQYSYNVVFTGEGEKNVGYLDKVTDPEARIKSTYYAKLKVNNSINAFDSSRTGTYTTESAKMLSKIKQYSDYGFIYDEVNNEIYNGNQSTANTTAISYLKLDLTDYEQDQFLAFDCLADTINSNSYGYISVGESLNNTGTQIVRLDGNNRTYSTIHKLEKGKVYYLYFGFVKGGGDINKYEGFKVSNFRLLGDGQPNRDFMMYEDPGYYPFVKQEDGSYVNGSLGQVHGPTSHGYMAFDLTNEDEDVDLILGIETGGDSSTNQFWVYTSDNTRYVGYGSSPNQIFGTSYATSETFYRIKLPKGKLTYIHFCTYTWYNTTARMTIKNVVLTKARHEGEVETSAFLTNSSDAYSFTKYDYDIFAMKDLVSNNNIIKSNRLLLDNNDNSVVLNGSNYLYVPNVNYNLTNYEESVYVEFTTPNKGNSLLYMGSSTEKICIALWSSSIIVSNNNQYSTFVMPETIDDGNIHSLLLTYKDDVYKLYYDGIALETTQSTDFVTGANTNSYIGIRSSGNNFVGKVYTTKIFNKELTPDELDNTENLQLYIDGKDSAIPKDLYMSSNFGKSNTVSHSYVEYDLTNVTEDKYLYVNTSISSESGDDIGYVQLTDSPDTPTSTTGLYQRISGTADNQTVIIKLNSGAVNYVHFRYTKDRDTNVGLDSFIINDVRLFDNISDAYSFNADYYSSINTMYFEKPVVNDKVDTIELLKDITLDASMVVPAEKEVILDLNGFTLTSNKDDYVIKNNGILTITDSDFKDRYESNVNYKTEQARLFETAKNKYLLDMAEYNEYTGLCEDCEPSEEYKLDHIYEYADEYGVTPEVTEFNYLNSAQEYTASNTGLYKVEAWGASGSTNSIGGKGAYTSGYIELNQNDTLYVYTGGQSTSSGATFNGGASCYNNCTAGGGATDIRLVSGNWDSSEGLASRIMVAAGGAGYNVWNSGYRGGDGGALVGMTGEGDSPTTGGTQLSGGISNGNDASKNGTFGKGGNGDYWGGGGSGGYWGGAGGKNSNTGNGGSSGSSYISGYTGSIAIKAVDDLSPRTVEYENENKVCTNEIASVSKECSYHYSGKKFDSAVMIAGNEEMPTYDGASTMKGNLGSGHAKIIYLLSSEEYQSYKNNLEKTYNIKEKPIFVNYIRGIDFDDSIDVDKLDVDSNITYSNIVDDTHYGSITSTIANVMLNEQYAKLTLDGAAINVNVNNKIGVVNRGLLTMKNDVTINANNSGTYGIYNESNGELLFNHGYINAKGSSSTGILNRSNTPNISSAIVVTTPSNAVGINNQATEDITYSDLDLSGAGTAFQDYATGDLVLTNSSIRSTDNYSFYEAPAQTQGKVSVINSNFYGYFGTSSSPKNIYISNSTLTHIYNSFGYISVDSSRFNSFDNRGDAYINNSTITSSGNMITNHLDGMYSGGTQHTSKMLVTNSTFNSTATSAVTLINNYHNLTVIDSEFNNINNAKSTVFNNPMQTFNTSYNYFTPNYPYLNISGNTVIDKSFGTAISNTGVVTIGSDDKNVGTVYNYGYTGKQEEFVAPQNGTYKLETWGAAGAEAHTYASGWDAIQRGGFGAYASGTITLNEGDKLYIHVGGYGSGYTTLRTLQGTYNGGGRADANGGIGNTARGAGGGATDISLSSEDNVWTYDNGVTLSIRSNESYNQRLVVAGGGGGLGGSNAGLTVNTSTRLGYGDPTGGGGYYGGTSQQGGSSYVDESLGDRVIIAGYDEMPDYNSGLMNGNTGFGYAKITLLDSDSDTVSNSPTIASTNYGITGNGRVIYYDGTITAKTALYTDIEKVAEDYDIYKSLDGEDEVVKLVANANSRPVESGEEEFVAAIGNAKYTTIQNAVNAANNGDEIDLLVDINQQNIVNIPENKTVTIDYNGHKVITYSDKYLFENNGNLTIKDSVNTKPKNVFYGDKYIYNTGTLDLNNIYIENKVYAQSIIDNNEGTITMNDVRLDFGSEISSKKGVANSENGNITVTNSVLNMTNANSLFDNNGTLTLKNNTIANNAYGQYIVFNRETGNAVIDGNTYSVSGDSRNGRYLIYNAGNGVIKNTSANVENVYNVGILHLQDNTIASGTITNANEGLLIIDNGSYSNTFNINGTGRSIDNTENLYAFIMHDGILNKTFNINTTGISSIESGTITTASGYAINNTAAGIINLGISDGSVDTKENTKPVITGKTYGIYTSSPALLVNFYDGIISGNKAYNVVIGDIETGYSIYREYDSTSNIETKYLTDEPMFTNVTQGVNYSSVTELNNAINNGSVSNGDTIQVYRNITVSKSDPSIVIPSGLKIRFDLNGKIVDKGNEKMFIVNGELDATDSLEDDWNERVEQVKEMLNVGTLDKSVYDYDYTGTYKKFVAPVTGTYKVELWGAQGGDNNNNTTSGNGNRGGYTSGQIHLTQGDTFYVYVGQGLGNRNGASFNGTTSSSGGGNPGGGATDIRFVRGTWSNISSLASRIMVAGGGGSNEAGDWGGNAGGLVGYSSSRNGYTNTGGSQIAGGIYQRGDACGMGSFGIGSTCGATGGGGYYGGAGANHSDGSGSGGSSYISGHQGAVAIASEQNISPRNDSNGNVCTMDSAKNDITCSYHYSGYKFTNTKMIDGSGYEWNADITSNQVGNPTVEDSSITEMGHRGNGHARISILTAEGDYSFSTEDVIEFLNMNGEYSPEETDSIGKVDSSFGNIFDNKGTLNIISGKYTSEKASEETTLLINNENATLNISGGTLTKYYDKLSYRLRSSGSIITNFGNANVTGGKFVPNGSYLIGYTRRWVDEGWYDYDQIYTSAVFINKETGVLNVTEGATFEGIISNTWHDTYEGGYWEGSGTNNDGQLIYNYGIATFTGTTTSPAGLGVNTGTLTFNNVDITGFRQINSQGHANFTNSGTFNLIDSHIDTRFSFINNNGGITNIDNSIVESNIGISYIISNGSGDNTTLNINDSELNNKVSGTVIAGSADISIKDSILNTKSGTLVSNSSKGLDIDNSTLTTDSGTAVSVSSGTVSVKKNSTVKTSSGVGISLSSSPITIGEPISDDGSVSKTKPLIKGTTYGIQDSSSAINFYDGIIYGKTNPVANAITTIESGYMIINDLEDDYKVNYLDRVPIVQNITQATASDEKKYYELDTAFSEAVDGDTLQMITNYSNLPDDVTAENNNNVIFDLNGFFIRQINDTLITNNGTLKIIDSSQDKTGQIIGISGSKVIDNYGTINYNSGKIISSAMRLIISNNSGATLNIRDEAKIDISCISTLVNNDGILNIYNGAYLYNIGGQIGSWQSSNSGLPMIINGNIANIIDLNNDDDENTSSDYSAPWLYSNGNMQSQESYTAPVTFDDPIILTKSGATTNIYGGIFNNGSTTSPNGGQIIKNQGTVNIKNLDSYAYGIGYNLGTLNIDNSYFRNFRMTALDNVGNLVIKDTTINFYSDTSAGTLTGNFNRLYSSGTALFDNVDFIGGNDTGNGDTYLDLKGDTEIRNSRFSALNAHTAAISNTSVLNIVNTSITADKTISNSGKLTFDNTNLTSSVTAISNSGTFNLKNGSTIMTTNGTGVDTSGTINIDNGTSIITNNGNGIYLSSGTANIGEIGNVPDQTTPYIEGTTFGIYKNTQTSNLNFYDGLIVGQTGPNAIYGGVTNVEGGYETEDIVVTDGDIQKHNEYLVVSATSVAVAQVGTYTFASVGTISPTKALQNAINFAIGDGTDVKVVNLVTDVDLVNDEVSLTASIPVTVNTNGHNVHYNDIYTVGSNITLNSNSIGGNISRIVADIFDLSYNAKNIVIYEMSDGSNLDSLKTYKLYKDDKLVSLSKEELGRYSYKGKNEELTPIKGRLYIDNLSKGSYRLVSNDNKSIEFSIDADGHITGNVVENPSDPNKVDPSSVAKAELTLAHQTGYTRHLYWIITIPIILVLFMLLKLSKKRETN